MSDDLVWYACYGSNLCYERFVCYLEGGKAPGAQRKQKGARDASEPSDERAVFINHQLYFSQHSINWQKGGVAFLDPRRDESINTWGRVYLITREQFEDVFRQENNKPDLAIDWEALLADGKQTVGEGWYNHIIKTGELEEHPILTFTNATNMNERGINPPSDNYLQCIIDGLRETYNIGKDGVKKYFRDVRGVKDKIKPQKITMMWQRAVDAEEN